jgi:hypothetical protein
MPGAFVPRNEQEAEDEFARLVAGGLSEQEAEQSIVSRVKGEADTRMGFVNRLATNVGDIASGLKDVATTFNPYQVFAHPVETGEALVGVGGGMADTLTKGLQKAKETWPQSKVEAAGRFAAAPLDALGLPISRSAEAFAAGDPGAGLADALTSVALALPAGKLASAAIPGRAGVALRAPVGSLKGLAKGVRHPVKGVQSAYSGVKGDLAQDAAFQKYRGASAALPEKLSVWEQELGAGRAARAGEAAGLPDDILLAKQVAQHEGGTWARGTAHAARQAELEAMSPGIDSVLKALEKQPGRYQLQTKLGAAQDARLGTQVARADAARSVQTPVSAHDATRPIPPQPDPLQLQQALTAREAKLTKAAEAVRKPDVQRGLDVARAGGEAASMDQLTMRLQQAVQNLERAHRGGDRIGIGVFQHHVAQAEQALQAAQRAHTFVTQ